MRVLRIALTGFRNYEWESFEFSPGTNVIRGKNGQGKTNLLEAVFMLTGGRSFRASIRRSSASAIPRRRSWPKSRPRAGSRP